jgi:hypothetical protein
MIICPYPYLCIVSSPVSSCGRLRLSLTHVRICINFDDRTKTDMTYDGPYHNGEIAYHDTGIITRPLKAGPDMYHLPDPITVSVSSTRIMIAYVEG